MALKAEVDKLKELIARTKENIEKGRNKYQLLMKGACEKVF